MWSHVVNRGADRQDLFHDDADFITFEALIADAVAKFGIELHALALMTNHFHALVHSPDDVLSESFHRICSIYAGYYNRRYERTGPLFEGRFRSVPVTSDDQLLAASRYVHRNPEAIVGTRALAAYRWSTYGAYVGSRAAPPWLSTDFTLDQFGGRRDRYRDFVEDGRPCEEEPHDHLNALAADDVERAVSIAADVAVEALHRSRRGTCNPPRLAAILLIHERRLAGSADIASRFDMGGSSAARNAARRARVLRCADPDFRRLCERAEAVLGDSAPR